VDNKHNLVVATQTINRNDLNAFCAIDLEAKENLGVATFTVVVDKGYDHGREIAQCLSNNITTIVAHPTSGTSKESVMQHHYLVAKFIYNKTDDTYACPQEETLKTTGRWHKKSGRTEQSGYQFKKYCTPACREWPVKHLCTARPAGREIDRSQHAQSVEENNKRYQENPQLYRTLQEINEHIFGTIKDNEATIKLI
jgi:hypothetical protein